jgi:hypothetical protein
MKKKLILTMFIAASLVALTQIPALLKENEIITNPILQPEDDNFFTFIYYYLEPIIENISYLILIASVVLNIAFYRQLKRTSANPKQTIA